MSAIQGAFAHGDTDDHRRQKDTPRKTTMNFCGISYACNSDDNFYAIHSVSGLLNYLKR